MENTKDSTNLWIKIDKASELLGLSEQTLKKQCRAGKFVYKIVKKGKRANYSILLKSMPDFAQNKYFGETELDVNYSEVPNWAKQQAEKYVRILEASKGLKGKDLENFVIDWNNNENEEYTTSYSSIIKMRKRYFRYGVAGLLSKHGQHLVGSCVSDDYFEYFKTLYLVEGAPSLRSCRDLTLGYAVREFGANRETFPSFMAFNYDIYQLVRKMLDDFNEDVANNQQIDTSRLHKFINLTEEMLKPKPKVLTLKEIFKIALKEYNIEDDLYNDDDEDWEIDF